ncbi:hypothetical protein [Streptomyces sp. TRM68416]|uniref:hypothetical protein n=1 Tax=Streptomyces sp. TRM68416 TaxID=2758412 RepID=UPI001661EB8B|nr:hypothetical protein [Streptomyces sp. TRM68416]MBD0841008.1 hypothetical protein [Streptomyces sp. TRM68416]
MTGAVAGYFFASLLMGPLQEEPPAAFLLGGMAVFLWALGWDSAIRWTTDRVSVTNLLLTSTVSWSDVARVTADDGLVISLRDGRTLGSVAFGSSLLGTFTGYRTHRRALRLLAEAHRTASQSPGDSDDGPARIIVTFEWRRLLWALAAVYGPLLIIWAL